MGEIKVREDPGFLLKNYVLEDILSSLKSTLHITKEKGVYITALRPIELHNEYCIKQKHSFFNREKIVDLRADSSGLCISIYKKQAYAKIYEVIKKYENKFKEITILTKFVSQTINKADAITAD